MSFQLSYRLSRTGAVCQLCLIMRPAQKGMGLILPPPSQTWDLTTLVKIQGSLYYYYYYHIIIIVVIIVITSGGGNGVMIKTFMVKYSGKTSESQASSLSYPSGLLDDG